MLLPTSANHNRNHNQICIASWTESYRGTECHKPIPESGAMATFYFFIFRFRPKMSGLFILCYFSARK